MSFPRHITPRVLFLLGIYLLAASLPLSKFTTSVSQFILIAAWLWEGRISEKIKTLFSNKTGLILSGLFFLHLIGLIYTEDYSYALNDLRIKLPLLLIPLFLATGPSLNRKEFNTALLIFVAAVLAGTLVSTAALAGLLHQPITEVRNISFLISHIRFSLMICLAFFICIRFWNSERFTGLQRTATALVMGWLVVFLVLMESVTGIIVLLVAGFILLAAYAWGKKSRAAKFSLFLILAASSAGVYFFVRHEIKDFYAVNTVDLNNLDSLTAEGNPYLHFKDSKNTENGNLIWIYICWREMEREWNRISPIPFIGRDKKGNELRWTLLRFLASKGERKDGAAVRLLTEEEIRSVENGIANVRYQGLFNLRGRIHQIIWEYDNYITTRNPSGHSAMQRFEYWRTGWNIFKENFWTGVGTGDVKLAYDRQYEKMNSLLERRWRLRAHNQYLTMFITFGVAGGLFFLFYLFAPWIFCRELRKDYLYNVFMIIVLASMAAEDTLETQAGVTFFIFFSSLLMFRENKFLLLNNQ
jgi:hypothetical protein